MEAPTVPTSSSSSSRYITSGLSTLSSWPLHDDHHIPRHSSITAPPNVLSIAALLPDQQHGASSHLNALTMALRTEQRTSNLYVDAPRGSATKSPLRADPLAEVQHLSSQHSSDQHSTGQRSTGQHSTGQHSTGQHSTGQRSSGHHSTGQHSTWLPSSSSSSRDPVILIDSVHSFTIGANRPVAVRTCELKLPRSNKDLASSFKINSELSSKNNSINSYHKSTSFSNTSDRTPSIMTSHQSSELAEKIITSENRIKTLTSESPVHTTGRGSPGSDETSAPCRRTISCTLCGGCRCEECTGARTAPKSVRRAVDVVSCVCCVQSVLYHCRGNCDEQDVEYEAGEDPSDRPCSCAGRSDGERCRRWTCMVLASVSCLPCLLLYWPLRLFLALCARCYDACTDLTRSPRGCRCRLDKDVKDGGRRNGRMTSSSVVREWSSAGPASTSSGHEFLVESENLATSQFIPHKFDLI